MPSVPRLLSSIMALLALAGTPALAQTETGGPGDDPMIWDTKPEDYAFAIMRKGKQIGKHTISFSGTPADLTVDVDISIRVAFGPIPLYRYRHHNTERWVDGRLFSMQSETTENGDEFAVSARAVDGGVRVDGMQGEKRLPASIIPTTYWNKGTITANSLLDSQRGIPLTIEDVTRADEAAGSDCHALEATGAEGEVDMTLCYEGPRLTKLSFRFEGNLIEYDPIDTES